jgi:spore germination cell wall hydrolase CwlJ-like protein
LLFRVTARPAARVLAVGVAFGTAAGLALGGVYAALAPDVAPPAQPAPPSAQPAAPPTAVAVGLRPALPAPAAPAVAAPAPQRVAQRPRTAGDLDCLADAVYYEARGEPVEGQAAIAQVVLNRTHRPGFPKTVCGVVFQGVRSGACQFSFACAGLMDRPKETAAWTRARKVAQRALAGQITSEVGQATHFHIAGMHPGWGPNLIRVAQVGVHVFYRMGHSAAVGSAPAHEEASPRLVEASVLPAVTLPTPPSIAKKPPVAAPTSAPAAVAKAEPAVAVVTLPAAPAKPTAKPAEPKTPAAKPAEVAAS